MSKGRLNWNARQSPTDEDQIAPQEVSYEFDYHRVSEPGQSSWPAKHQGIKFGPSLIRAAWKAGLVVVAQVEGLPRPVAVQECTWGVHGVLLVRTLEGLRAAERIWTRPNAKGLSCTGELMEEG